MMPRAISAYGLSKYKYHPSTLLPNRCSQERKPPTDVRLIRGWNLDLQTSVKPLHWTIRLVLNHLHLDRNGSIHPPVALLCLIPVPCWIPEPTPMEDLNAAGERMSFSPKLPYGSSRPFPSGSGWVGMETAYFIRRDQSGGNKPPGYPCSECFSITLLCMYVASIHFSEIPDGVHGHTRFSLAYLVIKANTLLVKRVPTLLTLTQNCK